jgi:hemoglobin-like flavoprotein
MLTEKQISLIQDSFAKLEPTADKVAEFFYKKLFELQPSYRSLFKEDMQKQGRKLMEMFSFLVRSLNNLHSLLPELRKLGQRHMVYGVKADMYKYVGMALMHTLEQGLGPAFTPEVKTAWGELYQTLSKTMIGEVPLSL